MENFKTVLENYDTTTPWKKERVRMTPAKTKWVINLFITALVKFFIAGHGNLPPDIHPSLGGLQGQNTWLWTWWWQVRSTARFSLYQITPKFSELWLIRDVKTSTCPLYPNVYVCLFQPMQIHIEQLSTFTEFHLTFSFNIFSSKAWCMVLTNIL